MFRFLILSFVFLPCFAAQATILQGHDRGNGGNIVSCPTQFPGYLFMDYFVASKRTSLAPLNPIMGDADSKVRNILESLEVYRPVLAASLRQKLDIFLEESIMLPDMPERVVDDYGFGNDLNLVGCQLRQLIVQVLDQNLRTSYFISESLWQELSEEQKAYAILHEILLKEFRASRSSVKDTSLVQWAAISLTTWVTLRDRKQAPYLPGF